jgi:pimeloyl-ACP methyl ester carboxylesterase
MISKAISSISLLCLLVVLYAPVAASSSDIAKERRWAEQVEDGLLDGDVVWLDDGKGNEFLGILTEGNPETGRAVVLMHGLGVHPNWPDVIYPLRSGLLDHGLTTLSIQMPILANDADEREYLRLFPEVAGRINAALDTLADDGYPSVVLVGHSMGASMMLHYMSRSPSSAVTSVVAIGISAGVGDRVAGDENIDALEKVRVPVLDLYGSEDLDTVLNSVADRAAAGGAVPEYRQVRVLGANHFFQGQESALLQSVLDWLGAQSSP